MSAIFAERALLPEGWARNVRFEISADGVLAGIRPDANADGAERLGGAVLPGMPNLHSHAFQRAMAGLAEVAGNPNDSFWTWRELMYRMVARLSPEQIEVIARQLYIEMLKAGYTAVAEFHYVHHDLDGRSYADPAELSLRISRAASAAGIGLTLLPVLYSHAGFGGQPASEGQRRFINGSEAYLELLQRLRAPLEAAGHSLGLCFHSLRAVTPQQIATVLAAGHDDLPVHIHIAEQQKEVDDCQAWSGRRPLQWLYENVAVDQRWCLVHATHADPAEVAAMARSGAVAGLCLSTEANLGDGIFPATDFLAQGGRLGIGSVRRRRPPGARRDGGRQMGGARRPACRGRAQRTGIRPGAGGTARLTLHSGGQPRCAYPPHSFEPSGAKRRYFPRQPPGVNGAGKKKRPGGAFLHWLRFNWPSGTRQISSSTA